VWTVFALPLLILGADGLTSSKMINSKPWAVDLLMMSGLLGFVVQSFVTYLVGVFPNSLVSLDCG
jgi:hypothetical protein